MRVLPFCKNCGAVLPENAKFCPNCGASVQETISSAHSAASEFIVVTTPTIPGYRIVKVLGVVTGLTPRTRGILGSFVGGIQSMFGGEVTAFTVEIEKARREAVERLKERARDLGANAVVGLDIETSDLLGKLIVISATGTAVVVERESQSP